MKFSTMIPQNFNDGKPIGHVTLEGVYRLLWKQYGGCTVDAVSDGYWWGPDEDGEEKLFVDKVRRATVYTPPNSIAHLDYAKMIVRKIGKLLKQEVMYFEHDASGSVVVKFLKIDPNKDYGSIE